MKEIYVLPALLLLYYSCSEDRTQDVRILALKFHKNRCEQLALEKSVDFVWKNVMERMEENMLGSIPVKGKQLNSDFRKAELLSSVATGDSLDIATRYLIKEASIAEEAALQQLKSLSEAALELEEEQASLFNEIEATNPDALPKMRELFESISHRPCDGIINNQKQSYYP